MMMHSIVRKINVFEIEIKDLSGSFQFKLEVSKVGRETLLSLQNPNQETVLKQNQHLWNMTMNHMDKKTQLTIQRIFGAKQRKVAKLDKTKEVWYLILHAFDCFCQSLFSRRKTGYKLMSPPKFDIFLTFATFLRS